MSTPCKNKAMGEWVAAALVLMLAAAAPADADAPIRVPSDPNITPPFIMLPDSSSAGTGLAPDRASLAVGAAYAPDYEGSRHYAPTPVAGAMVRWHGHAIGWHGNSLGVDLVPEYRNQSFKLIVVPFVEISRSREGVRSNPDLALLPKRKTAVEGGAVLGAVWKGIMPKRNDLLTLQVAARQDLGSVHGSFVITPSLSYVAPLSRAALVSATASLDVAGAGYARYNFGIDSAASIASGLPAYRPGGGIKSAAVGLGGLVSLQGDLRQGFAVGLLLNYERLLGDVAASPLVTVIGSPDQFNAMLGLTYTF